MEMILSNIPAVPTRKITAVFMMVVFWMAMLPVAMTTIPLTGCPLTAAQTENEINTIIQEAAGIIAVADPGVSWLADFSKAANLLKVDEAAWVKGGAVQDVINVLTDLEQVTTMISSLVPYANLIGVLVAGIVQVLALLLPPPTNVTPTTVTVSAPNPWKGRATVTSAKDSKAQWNAIVTSNPALGAARLQ